MAGLFKTKHKLFTFLILLAGAHAIPYGHALVEQETPLELETQPTPEQHNNLEMLGSVIGPGEAHRLLWVASETTYGSELETSVYVVRGVDPGPTLCLTAAIHGDELNGVEIVRKVLSNLSADSLSGTVIGVPIVNLLGFTRGSRYLPDRRDLNRYFPGNPNGSSASRIAHAFFNDIVQHCDLLIDLHTGSLNRTNMPQIRANLSDPKVVELTTKFGSTAVLNSRKLSGNLRSAASSQGIPAVALELGEPGSLQEDQVTAGVKIIESAMRALDMSGGAWTIGGAQPVYYSSRWVRVNYGGLLIGKVDVGKRIRKGDVLGKLVNPLSNETYDIVSPHSGRLLGKALNQFMLPGYAAFHIGIVASEEDAVEEAKQLECGVLPPESDAPQLAGNCPNPENIPESDEIELELHELEDEEES